MLNQLAVTLHRSRPCSVYSLYKLWSDHSDHWFLSRPWIRCFSFFVSRPLKILRNLQGKMGHAWSRGLTGISALLPNLPHIRRIYGQLVDSGHCSPNFWPQGLALNRLQCNFVPRTKDCNRDRCQGRFAPVVKVC